MAKIIAAKARRKYKLVAKAGVSEEEESVNHRRENINESGGVWRINGGESWHQRNK